MSADGSFGLRQSQLYKTHDGTRRTRWLRNRQGVRGDNKDVSPEAHHMDLGRTPLIHLYILVYIPVFFYVLLRVYMYPSRAVTMRTHP